MSGAIHPTALVAADAELAADVRVGPFAVIGAGVRIGRGTVVGPHAVIEGPTVIGEGNRIFQFASVGADPQDKKYRGEVTRLEIGDRNVIRECATIHRGTVQDRGVTRIGNDNLFMAYSHVAHDCVIGSQCVLANQATLAGHVHLGDWVIMGGLSAIHQFGKVGAHAFIANNAAVTLDVPPYVMAVGQPAGAHSVNTEGLRRRGFSSEQIGNIRNAFRLLYRSGLKLAEATERLAELAAGQPELRPLVEFLPQATRGIVR
ncbi:MAG: acyl-ACP--UDP-N-acetylglucosamine O-acyltransferase [Steroidobacteraceae bacterium]